MVRVVPGTCQHMLNTLECVHIVENTPSLGSVTHIVVGVVQFMPASTTRTASDANLIGNFAMSTPLQ